MSRPPQGKSSNLPQIFRQAADWHKRDQLNEAAKFYTTILAAQPKNVEALHRLGVLRSQQGRNLEARVLLAAALKLDARSAEALSDYGNVLQNCGHFNEAVVAFDQALAIRPDYAEAFYDRGKALRRLNRAEEALASFDSAIALKPDYALAISKRGSVLTDLDRPREALEWHYKALAINPELSEAHCQAAYAHFSLGDLATGWRQYEWRFRQPGSDSRYGVIPRDYFRPRWNGGQLDGTLLVWGEQGLGDQILYAGMIPDLVDCISSIVLEVDPRLESLFARSFPAVKGDPPCARAL